MLALLIIAAVAPAVAGAQTETALAGVFTDTGSPATGSARGAFSLASFATQEDTLVASGPAQVSFCLPDVDPQNCLATFEFTLGLPVTEVAGDCDTISVTLGGTRITVGDRFVLDVEATTPLALTGGTRAERCRIARHAGSTKAKQLARALNRLL